MAKQVRTKARVQLTIELEIDEPFDSVSYISQVHERAVEVAHQRLRGGLPHLGTMKGDRIVGEPKVTMILVEETG